MIDYSERLKRLPPYLFVEIDRKKKELEKKGVKIIDFGVGDPDLPTPDYLISEMGKALRNRENYHYPLGRGKKELRDAISLWMRKRFNVGLDAEKEILVLIGSKEGIAHLPLGFINPGDYLLIPEPSYPVYQAATIFAGGKPYSLPLLEKNNFLPDLESIPEKIRKKGKILFLNYPNNPTGSVATKEFFERVIDFGRRYGIIILQDAAYSEIYFGEKPSSILEIPEAKEISIEFHSFSKTFNMTGWRLGWACGNERLIDGLAKVKENIDSGAFSAIQDVGIVALSEPEKKREERREIYRERRDILVSGLRKIGWEINEPKATFYLWARVPSGFTSTRMVNLLLDKAGILTTPGNGFGKDGEGYVRFSLTLPTEKIKEAIGRLKDLKIEL